MAAQEQWGEEDWGAPLWEGHDAARMRSEPKMVILAQIGVGP